ncbi:hypothetical protein SAV14893_045480 [Streptomyces avermitilis]|uniref:Uncharacterized protein n=1 Tax=Streptomyces avermitilis TaxID=33903 RepID=A0A4D4LVX3_STRAX|nr:hypothetical protein SAV14893_045480 [Streptomyces avermitilis]GDY83681.1 hypothetical protein SAVCW2_28800 [Streptomyces avermitilis]
MGRGLLRRRGRGGAVRGGLFGLRLGLGAQPAGAAALARGLLGGDRLFLGKVVVHVTAAARQGEHHQDDGECALRPQPAGVAERRVEGDVQLAAGGREFEALGPAVDRGAGERLAVQGRGPALVGGVGDPQYAARGARGKGGVQFDGAGRDGLRFAGAGDDGGAGDLPVHAPQGAPVPLAEPAQAGSGVQDAADLAGRALADQDVAHGEAAEFVGLVGAGARDEVGDDLVEPLVLAARRREFGIAQPGAGAADQGVADAGR